jgi:hypothetical protein
MRQRHADADDATARGSGAAVAAPTITFRDRTGRLRAGPAGRQWADSDDHQQLGRDDWQDSAPAARRANFDDTPQSTLLPL